MRLSRSEQVERNRERVLDAARRVFLANGYARASLDAIAEEAGFSKGVVYSQFESKADLFLALLEARILERAQDNARLAAKGGLAALLGAADQAIEREPQWSQLVLEFRLLAARDPQLNARYARAHAHTRARIAAWMGELFANAGAVPPAPPETLADLILAMDSGMVLERAVNPGALPAAVLGPIIARGLGLPFASPGEGGPR